MRIPGVNVITIQNVTAEIGTQMNQFPSDAHLASWAGMCPGNEESAGKRKRSKTTKGDRWLRRALDPSGLGGHTHPRQLSWLPVSSPCRPKGQKASPAGRRPHVARDHLPYHQVPRRLSHLGPDYASCGPRTWRLEATLSGQASGTTRLRGATRGETRRIKRHNYFHRNQRARDMRPPAVIFEAEGMKDEGWDRGRKTRKQRRFAGGIGNLPYAKRSCSAWQQACVSFRLAVVLSATMSGRWENAALRSFPASLIPHPF